MSTVTLKGNPIHTNGTLPAVGTKAPDFRLTTGELSDVTLASYAGKVRILNIVPSLDTGVCAASAKRFEKETGALKDTVILTVSADLPFAMGRFCQAEGITHVVPLSMMRDRSFAKDYGVEITDGPLAGISARAVVVVDKTGKVTYTELVPEIAQEPDYTKALAAAKAAG